MFLFSSEIAVTILFLKICCVGRSAFLFLTLHSLSLFFWCKLLIFEMCFSSLLCTLFSSSRTVISDVDMKYEFLFFHDLLYIKFLSIISFARDVIKFFQPIFQLYNPKWIFMWPSLIAFRISIMASLIFRKSVVECWIISINKC